SVTPTQMAYVTYFGDATLVRIWIGRPRFLGLHVDGGLAALAGGADFAAAPRPGAPPPTGALNASMNNFRSGFRLRGARLARRGGALSSHRHDRPQGQRDRKKKLDWRI